MCCLNAGGHAGRAEVWALGRTKLEEGRGERCCQRGRGERQRRRNEVCLGGEYRNEYCKIPGVNCSAFWVLPVQRVRSAVDESGEVVLEDSGVAKQR